MRDVGLPLPASLVLLSPWTGLSLSGESKRTHANRKPMLSNGWLEWAADAYRGQASQTDPACSPLFVDLSGLPPMLIQVVSEEVLLSDALRLFQHAKTAGLTCQLQPLAGM